MWCTYPRVSLVCDEKNVKTVIFGWIKTRHYYFPYEKEISLFWFSTHA